MYANGSVDWQQIVDNNGMEDVGNYGMQTSDSGYIVTGNTGVYQQQTLDVWLIKFQGNNQPPYEPSNPSPANNSVDQNLVLNLSWTGGDPNGDPVVYDVSFGTTPSPPMIAMNLTVTSYNPGALASNITYFWKIRATDAYGASTEGPLWSFTTKKQLPVLEIGNITGKIGVSSVVRNVGMTNASTIRWRIIVTGGMLRLIHKNITGNLATLQPGHETPIASGMFFGFGPISITVSALCAEVPTSAVKNATGKIILFWVKVTG